ncbi:MAG: 50S ribosomal protein L10 [Chloroflexi bacterium]|nr:50S ribosomal protein L10 [Chloroflexota bacterium]
MANPKTAGKKRETVDELANMLKKSHLAVLTDYRGLTVSDLAQLRRQLHDAGVEYHVVKNTLASFAAKKVDLEDLAPMFVGPTAVALSGDDVTKAAKMLKDYARTSKVLKIRGGALDGDVIGPEQVDTLADLPPRDVLVAQLLGGIQSPLASLVGMLNAPLQNLAYALQARAEKLEAAS